MGHIEIPVGRETFRTKGEICQKCNAYALTREMRSEMDAWGEGFAANFIDLQPSLPEVLREYIDSVAEKLTLSRAQYIKVMVAFYIVDISNAASAEEIEVSLRDSDLYGILQEGARKTVQFQVRYRTYRELMKLAIIRRSTPTKVVEEIIAFCATLRSEKDAERLKEIKARLEAAIQMCAFAA